MSNKILEWLFNSVVTLNPSAMAVDIVTFIIGVIAPFVIGYIAVHVVVRLCNWFVYHFAGGRAVEVRRREQAIAYRKQILEESLQKQVKEREARWEQQRLLQKQRAEEARRLELKIKQDRQVLAKRYNEEKAEQERLTLEKRKKLFSGSFESLGNSVFLESSLPKAKQEELFAKGYKRLKTSPYGDSGSSIYWVYARHNESKEHAFFCYLIRALVETFVEEDKTWLHTTRRPDVVCKWKDKMYCFDVETGSNWARRKEWVKRKFAYYTKRYDKSFIFVTSKKLKFKYRKLGIVVTRATLRKTLEKLFQKQSQEIGADK